MGGHLQRRIDRAGARRQAAELQHPTHLGRHQCFVGRVIAVRAVATERADPGNDESRVGLCQFVVTQVVRGQGWAAHPDVGALRQPALLLASDGVISVEHSAALATQPERRRDHAAPRVAGWRLELDHLRAEIAQHHRGQARHRALAFIDHQDPAQR